MAKIDCWYSKGGSLISNDYIESIDAIILRDDDKEYYGGNFLIAESMTLETAKAIATALGLNFIEKNGG